MCMDLPESEESGFLGSAAPVLVVVLSETDVASLASVADVVVSDHLTP